ncbi:Transmembrane protein, putative [Acanthamoeba castellanii str. Neff]|uniref:ER membrane protein complex subunit 3 n=1 Tax=Acanthamoeba castellanii (strain ATCC 30010 / Neff) TaxID=1257118 RepID=L8GWH7_ACACF|nr:Transmembrane protein, putative [Acanthamoeba castellanii str. Neff]ELR17292.1 Transmembrane protein, putative [Acanthamoeba castellanii str. Neff]
MTDDLVLDSRIRDWVLLPIALVMFLIAILRNNISLLLHSERKPELQKVQERQTLIRASRMRLNGHKLPLASFLQRKAFFNDAREGVLVMEEEDSSASNPLANPMMDPMNMVDMMKKNVTMLVPQLLIVGWVQYFFSGFVLVKIPFPLTLPFRGMLQRGIELAGLEVTYVSSLSWYFLNLFGLRGINSLVLGEANAADDTKLMQQQMMMGGGGPIDTKKLYKAERENIDLVEHKWAVEDAEKRLLNQKSSSSSSKASASRE